MIRWLIDLNRRASHAFDRLLPESYRIDGNQDFVSNVAPSYFYAGQCVVDVGGGRRPYVSVLEKSRLGLRVIGLDIDAEELATAPAGSYDEVVVADVARVRRSLNADLVVCQAVLEHVRDTAGAFAALAAMVKPGGRILVFVPSRNAVFARLNLMMPEGLKRRLLFAIYPSAKVGQGFVSYYSRCTPNEFGALARATGLTVEREILYYSSSYFTFFLPLHVIWRLIQGVALMVLGRQGVETFVMVLRK